MAKTTLKIFVGNMNFTTTEDDLRKLFEPRITIEDIVIVRDEESGESKGYGFILTKDKEAGREAVNQIGKVEMDGRRVYFKEAHGKKFQKPVKRRKSHRPSRRSRPRMSVPRSRPSRPPGSAGYSAADDDNRGNC